MADEKILIVDDEKLVRWSLRRKCEEWGYQVHEAESGSQAMQAVRNEMPDLMLLDVRMPDLDRKSTRLNSSHIQKSRMPSSA